MNNENIFLLLSKKWFLRTQKTQKNKNTPPSPNKFFVFFIFKNKKRFLKTGTKHAQKDCWVREFLVSPQPNSINTLLAILHQKSQHT